MEQITMLGTGNAMCTRCYNTCFYLHTAGGSLMVDAGGGNGIFKQLHRAGIAFENIQHLFVTHCHTDHIMGAIWVIRKISPMMHHGRYKSTFHIYCHNEVSHALLTMCRLMLPSKIMAAVGSTIVIHTVVDGEQVVVGDMQVTFFDVGSSKMKQFGMQALLPSGKRVVCLGDEPYNERNEHYARGCDWLLHESFCLDKDKDTFRPYEKHHSTALDAGKLAQELGVKNLLLYHTEDTHLSTRRLSYTAEAARHFKGNIHVPDDIETLDL
jgi:hypothetical protein